MTELAGITQLLLYERKDLTFSYPSISDPYSVFNITNSGEKYNLENCQESRFKIKPKLNKNYGLAFDYELEFLVYDLSIDNILFLKQIKQSIYGFAPYLIFNNGDEKFINASLFFNEAIIDNNVSNSFKVIMSTRISTQERILDIGKEKGYLLISSSEFLSINSGGELLAIN